MATGQGFRFLWAWGGLSPVGCSVRVHHPLYRSGYAPVSDDFANDLGTITLQSFDEFLSEGPTYAAWRGPALRCAIQQNARPDIVDALIEHGAIENARDPGHVVALFQVAARAGKSAMLHKLVAAGVPPDLASESGYTALMSAARKGHVEAARTLIELGASVNAREQSGKTALSEAREHGHDEVVALLEEKDALPASAAE